MNGFLRALAQYANFSGRASRAEYWQFILYFLILTTLASLLDVFLGTDFGLGLEQQILLFLLLPIMATGFISLAVLLFLFIPLLSVTARRLHDTGRSTRWLLLGLIPVFGFLALNILAGFRGQVGENADGDNPILGKSGVRYIRPR